MTIIAEWESERHYILEYDQLLNEYTITVKDNDGNIIDMDKFVGTKNRKLMVQAIISLFHDRNYYEKLVLKRNCNEQAGTSETVYSVN